MYNINSKDNFKYLTFPSFEKYGDITHLFTSRLGGVSTGCYESMNMGFCTGDDKDNILKNYEILAEHMNIDVNDFVMGELSHSVNVRKVTSADRGKGVTKPQDYEDIDGLITNERGLALVTTHADCTPLFFYDPVKSAIGMAHSGWMGTLNGIAKNIIDAMVNEYGCEAKDIIVGIGPSLCQSCFEVDKDVADKFIKKDEYYKNYMYTRGEKTYIDLWKINEYMLMSKGVLKENIENMELCTKENMEILFSHRGQKGKRGVMAGVIMLNK